MIKDRIWEIIETAKNGGRAARIFNLSIISLILLNVLAIIFDSINSIQVPCSRLLDVFETFSIAVFSIEYLIRLWACTSDPRYAGTFKGRLKYILSPMAFIDLIAILPFYLVFLNIDLRFIRVFRVFRIVRIVKMGRYLSALKLFGRVLKAKKEEVVISVCVMLGILVISSCLIYYLENPVQPEAFPNILAAMWWAVSTVSTVGYGDIIPHTALGKLLASLVALLGIGFFALPAGIVSSGFIEEMKKDKPKACPHCGKQIE